MSFRIPFKKPNPFFAFIIIFIVGLTSFIGYQFIDARAEFTANKVQDHAEKYNEFVVSDTLVQLEECAKKHKSSKFQAVSDDFHLKFYEDPQSLTKEIVGPALFECNRLTYQ